MGLAEFFSNVKKAFQSPAVATKNLTLGFSLQFQMLYKLRQNIAPPKEQRSLSEPCLLLIEYKV